MRTSGSVHRRSTGGFPTIDRAPAIVTKITISVMISKPECPQFGSGVSVIGDSLTRGREGNSLTRRREDAKEMVMRGWRCCTSTATPLRNGSGRDTSGFSVFAKRSGYSVWRSPVFAKRSGYSVWRSPVFAKRSGYSVWRSPVFAKRSGYSVLAKPPPYPPPLLTLFFTVLAKLSACSMVIALGAHAPSREFPYIVGLIGTLARGPKRSRMKRQP